MIREGNPNVAGKRGHHVLSARLTYRRQYRLIRAVEKRATQLTICFQNFNLKEWAQTLADLNF